MPTTIGDMVLISPWVAGHGIWRGKVWGVVANIDKRQATVNVSGGGQLICACKDLIYDLDDTGHFWRLIRYGSARLVVDPASTVRQTFRFRRASSRTGYGSNGIIIIPD
ncbi:MAG: hypothetical protein PW790_06380 [Parvibaculaceae bacterium]|nr:hypothetical protein [Parvibaculaceae bacterium]